MTSIVVLPDGSELKFAEGYSVTAAEDRIRNSFQLRGLIVEMDSGTVVSSFLQAGTTYRFRVLEGNECY